MIRIRHAFAACFALLTIVAATASPAGAQDFSALTGKTVRFIIGANGGGSTDRYARLFIDSLQPLLPNTTLVAQNLPGGDGQLAIAEAMGAGPNAVTILVIQTGPFYEQLRQTTPPAIDIGRFHAIGSLASNQRVLGMRTSLGAADFDELVALDRNLITLTNSVTAANHMESIIVAAITGIHTQIVTGVEDQLRDPMIMAGEADLSVSSFLNLRPLFQSGAAIPVLRTGTTGYAADLASLPTLADVARPGTPPELIEMIDTLNILGRLLMAVPGTDPAAVDALRAAFAEVVAAPAVAAAYAAQSLDLSPTGGAEVERRMGTLLGNASAGAAFREYLACGEREAEAGRQIDCPAP